MKAHDATVMQEGNEPTLVGWLLGAGTAAVLGILYKVFDAGRWFGKHDGNGHGNGNKDRELTRVEMKAIEDRLRNHLDAELLKLRVDLRHDFRAVAQEGRAQSWIGIDDRIRQLEERLEQERRDRGRRGER